MAFSFQTLRYFSALYLSLAFSKMNLNSSFSRYIVLNSGHASRTCLNFFSLADELEVGRVTDMLEIASRLADAGRIVRP